MENHWSVVFLKSLNIISIYDSTDCSTRKKNPNSYYLFCAHSLDRDVFFVFRIVNSLIVDFEPLNEVKTLFDTHLSLRITTKKNKQFIRMPNEEKTKINKYVGMGANHTKYACMHLTSRTTWFGVRMCKPTRVFTLPLPNAKTIFYDNLLPKRNRIVFAFE